jgi:uncharacterized membrane protein YcaP (DUF421 family)
VNTIEQWLGTDAQQLSFAQMAVRAILVFVFALALVRLAGKRFLGRQTAFDTVLGIIVGSVLSRAINGSAPLLPTLGASLVLLAVHRLFGSMAYRSVRMRRWIKGSASKLMDEGAIQWRAMAHDHVTSDDLVEELRLKSQSENVAEIRSAYLESNGKISVIPQRRP